MYHTTHHITKQDITDEDYDHIKAVWQLFGMQSFGDYHSLYLKLDVLILADAFNVLRKEIYNDFNLDLCHNISLSLEVMQDRTMFTNKAAYVGMSTCGNVGRHKANNKYLPDFNSSQPTSFILYLDAVNM